MLGRSSKFIGRYLAQQVKTAAIQEVAPLPNCEEDVVSRLDRGIQLEEEITQKDEEIIIDEDARLITINRSICAGEICDFSSYFYKIFIKGDVGDGAIVKNNGGLEVTGDIGNNCELTATQIRAGNIGKNSKLEASLGLIHVKNIGESAQVFAGRSICANDVERGASITSSSASLNLGDVEADASLTSPLGIYFQSIHHSVILNGPGFKKIATGFYKKYVPQTVDTSSDMVGTSSSPTSEISDQSFGRRHGLG